jgi:membrane protease YdiL (CAAX protease family)
MENKKKNKNYGLTIIFIGLLVLLAVFLRHPGYAYISSHEKELGYSPWAAWSVSMAAVGIITFFGFLWLGYKEGGQMALNKEGMRLAIVAAVVVVDLVLISTVIFPFTIGEEISELGKSIITQFNTTVGIVAGFYFGTSAYIQAQGKDKEGNGDKENVEKK